MTLSRTRKAAIVSIALLAFLAQGANAAHGVHGDAAADTVSVAPEPGKADHDPIHHHHDLADSGQDRIVSGATGTACEEARACLCCIGSCASLLLNAAAATAAFSTTALRPAHAPAIAGVIATSLYRPPIPA